MEHFKILIVEDDLPTRKALRESFTEAGFEILEAGDGVEAFKIIKTAMPSLIILDMMLPGMNGGEILKKLKSEAEYKDIPVIILSALTDNEVISQIIDSGVFDYFSKANISIEDLIARVKKRLGMK